MAVEKRNIRPRRSMTTSQWSEYMKRKNEARKAREKKMEEGRELRERSAEASKKQLDERKKFKSSEPTAVNVQDVQARRHNLALAIDEAKKKNEEEDQTKKGRKQRSEATEKKPEPTPAPRTAEETPEAGAVESVQKIATMTVAEVEAIVNKVLGSSALATRVSTLESGDKETAPPVQHVHNTYVTQMTAKNEEPRYYEVRPGVDDDNNTVDMFLPWPYSQPGGAEVEWSSSSSTSSEFSQGGAYAPGGGWVQLPGVEYGQDIYVTVRKSLSDKVNASFGGFATTSWVSWVDKPTFVGVEAGATGAEPGVIATNAPSGMDLAEAGALIESLVASNVLTHTSLVAKYSEDVGGYVTMPGDHLLRVTKGYLYAGGGSGGSSSQTSHMTARAWELRKFDDGSWGVFSPVVEQFNYTDRIGQSDLEDSQESSDRSVQPYSMTSVPKYAPFGTGKRGEWVNVSSPTAKYQKMLCKFSALGVDFDTSGSIRESELKTLDLAVSGGNLSRADFSGWFLKAIALDTGDGLAWVEVLPGVPEILVDSFTPTVYENVVVGTAATAVQYNTSFSDAGGPGGSEAVKSRLTAFWIAKLVVGGVVVAAKEMIKAIDGDYLYSVKPMTIIDKDNFVGGAADIFLTGSVLSTSPATTQVAAATNVTVLTGMSYESPTAEDQQGSISVDSKDVFTWVWQEEQQLGPKVLLYTEVANANEVTAYEGKVEEEYNPQEATV